MTPSRSHDCHWTGPGRARLPGRPHAGGLRIGLLLVLAQAAACGGNGGGDPWGRQDDGLLQDAALQRLVEHQVARQAAPLTEALTATDPGIRARAALALGSVQDPATRGALMPLLDDPVATVRSDVAFALGQLPDTVDTQALVHALRAETDPRVRERLIEAIGKSGGRAAEALLLRTEFRTEERPALALALARFGLRGVNNAVGVETLLEMMGDPDPDVRTRAAWYFARSSGAPFWAPVAGRVREAARAAPLDDPAGVWLLRALVGMPASGDDELALRWLAEAPSWHARMAALEVLEQHRGIPRIKTGLAAALADSVTHVRVGAARGLALRGDELTDAEFQFVTTWMDEHADQPAVVGELLPILARRTAGQPVVAWLESRMDDPEARAHAVRVLAGIPGPIARRALVDLAQRTGPTGVAALEALAGRGPADRPDAASRQAVFAVAAAALEAGRADLTQTAAAVLGSTDLAEFGAEATIIEALQGGEPGHADEGRVALLRALGAVGTAEGSREVLAAYAGASSAAVRRAATASADALGLDLAVAGEATAAATLPIDWSALAALGRHPQVAFDTDRGRFVVALDASQAPQTVSSFLSLVRAGDLDGVPFHRVVAPFVIQGGDADGGTGYGAAPYRIRSELARLPFAPGTLGMASSGKDTEATQFFVTHLMTPHLDGAYTAFGRVVEGMEVVEQILVRDRIVSALVLDPS